MQSSTETIPQSNALTVVDTERDTRYLAFFSKQQAIADFHAHINSLPSSRTPEQYTRKVYQRGLDYFLDWSADALPTANLIKRYISHLADRRLKSATINSGYIVPLRHYLTSLANQPLSVDQLVPALEVSEGTPEDVILDALQKRQLHIANLRGYLDEARQHIQQAANVKSPRKQKATNFSPLWSQGTRLDINQVNAILRQIDTNRLMGLRNYAFMRTAFESAFRIAELHRMTRNSITRDGENHLISVRGKRSNHDPIPVSSACITAINAYVDAYNAYLSADDPRYIHADTPIWQAVSYWHDQPAEPTPTYDPATGISKNSLRLIITKTSERVLGKGNGLSAHDTRRTAAAIAHNAGMPLNAISGLLRHADPSVTLHYIGKAPNHEASTLTQYAAIG